MKERVYACWCVVGLVYELARAGTHVPCNIILSAFNCRESDDFDCQLAVEPANRNN